MCFRYFVRCWTPLDNTAVQLNATVTGNTTHTFVESDGVVDNTIYLCVVHLRTNIDGIKSYTAASDPVHFTSLLDTSKITLLYSVQVICTYDLYNNKTQCLRITRVLCQ